MNWVMVGGKFNDAGGKPSGYVSKLYESMSDSFPYQGILFNGGYSDDLIRIRLRFDRYQAVIWIPDIPNSAVKIVNRIKVENPHSLLVISKNNRDGGHDIYDLLNRALKAHANLIIEFTGKEKITASVIDPLGNCFIKSDNVGDVGAVLGRRIFELSRFTRMGSKQFPGGYTPEDDSEVLEFIKIARKHADTFHDLIHGHDTERFLGNCSFRCMHGFPSHRGKDGIIWVSRRNMDKRELGVTAFVPCKLIDGKVCYWGEAKPSVDAPIQLMLYRYFKNINFMLHSHVYIHGYQSLTKKCVPCGALEEFYEIVNRREFPADTRLGRINLMGHGSLVMAQKAENIADINYIMRKVPEYL